MTPTDHLAILIRFQKWRKGDDEIEQPDPRDISGAIDYAIQCCEAIQRIDAALADRENGDLWFMRRSEIRAMIALMEAK